MRNPVEVVAGVVVAALGLLFFCQGIGVTGGTGGMNGTVTWSVLGPIIAIIGIALVVHGTRARGSIDADL